MTEERLYNIAHSLSVKVVECRSLGDSLDEIAVAIQGDLRLAIKESSEEKDEVIRRLSLATDSDSGVGSCDCLTKSPDIQHHKRGCKYRLIVERDEALHEIQALKTIIHEQDRAIAKMALREPLNLFNTRLS